MRPGTDPPVGVHVDSERGGDVRVDPAAAIDPKVRQHPLPIHSAGGGFVDARGRQLALRRYRKRTG